MDTCNTSPVKQQLVVLKLKWREFAGRTPQDALRPQFSVLFCVRVLWISVCLENYFLPGHQIGLFRSDCCQESLEIKLLHLKNY
jgi:hypothetical protein